MLVSISAFAAGGDLGQLEKQPTNWTAIIMFAVFVVATLFITKAAAAKTKSAADFYRGRRHHRLPERHGDCRRLHVRRFLSGISAAVMANGYDGLIY